MRGKTSDARATGSARSVLGVLAMRRCRFPTLASGAVLLFAVSIGMPSEGPEAAAQRSPVTNEVGASNHATPLKMGDTRGLVSSAPSEVGEAAEDDLGEWRALLKTAFPEMDPNNVRAILDLASDPEVNRDDLRTLLEHAARDAEAFSALQEARASRVPGHEWPAPLLKMVSSRIVNDPRGLSAPVMAAIELHHNEESFRLLLKYGLKDDGRGYARSDGEHWLNPAVEALWFLRAYDPTDEARAEVEKQLQTSLSQSDGAWQAGERARYLKALLASWDFAQGLSESRRKAYQDYERRRWMAWSLTSSGAPRAQYGKFTKANKMCPWPEGDEDFFLRNYECPVSTKEEILLSGLSAFVKPDGALRFSEEGKRRLEAVAKSDLPWAEEAANVLSTVERAQSEERSPLSPDEGQ